MDGRTRYGYPFRSIEQQAMRRVTPYSNFEGGEELDLKHDVERVDDFDGPPTDTLPHVERLTKPTSGPDRGQ